MVSTDVYSQAAQAEASGYDALVAQVSHGGGLLCANELALPAELSAASGKAITQ